MSAEILPSPLDRLGQEDTLSRKLECGQTLFVQESESAGLFFLVAGTIDLKRSTIAGHSITIHRARAGDTFAEASLFSNQYHCTATAVNECQLIECRRSVILDLLKTDLEFAYAMTSRFASQIQESRRRVELLSIRAADERIIAALRDGLLVDDVVAFADIIGLAPATVYRTLTRLDKEGQISKTARGRYQIR